MYLTRLRVENVRCLESVEWRLQDGVDPRGWHVVLGDNGAGKSTLLRSASLTLLGLPDAEALRQDWDSWLRRGCTSAQVLATYISAAAMGVPPRTPEQQELGLEPIEVRLDLQKGHNGRRRTRLSVAAHTRLPHWDGAPSIFSAGYGPFRRFHGSERETERLFESRPNLARHISLFGEHVALGNGLDWLVHLDHAKDEFPFQRGLLQAVVEFINKPGLLPDGVRLTRVSSQGVEFSDAAGLPVEVGELSDGFQAVLALLLDLVSRLADDYEPLSIFDEDGIIWAPAICLVEEIDAHLHPTWQTEIGPWLVKHLPNAQFIVSTHSPLVCQAAVNGSVFRLPHPAQGGVGEMLSGTALNRLRYGNVLDAFSSGAFGETRTRSAEGEAMADRLAALNMVATRRPLKPAEEQERSQLREVLPTLRSATGS